MTLTHYEHGPGCECRECGIAYGKRGTIEPLTRKTLTIMQASEAVGVGRRTIYHWLKSGRVQFCRTASGAVRIYADTLWRGPDTPPIRHHQPKPPKDVS